VEEGSKVEVKLEEEGGGTKKIVRKVKRNDKVLLRAGSVGEQE